MDHNQKNEVRQEYISRINIVLDYIETHLTEVISLDDLAQVSGFSKYHFHRIFSSLMKETLYHYIMRLRLEKAMGFLRHMPAKPITEIALDFGFSDSAMFARLFKQRYGMSASVFRKRFSKNCKETQAFPVYDEENVWRETQMDMKYSVEVKQVPEMTVVYLRHVGTYASLGKVFQKMIRQLIGWAMNKGVAEIGKNMLLAVYHDNPEITEDEKRRVSIGLTVPEGTKPEGEFGVMRLSEGLYAVGHFEIDDEKASAQHQASWQYMFGSWLPGSGYQPDDKVVFEAYVNDPSTHPERKHLIDIYMPVKPL